MATSIRIEEILHQVEKLESEDQLSLLNQLTVLLKKTTFTKDEQLSLTSLSGLGREIWKNKDIDTFLDNERAW